MLLRVRHVCCCTFLGVTEDILLVVRRFSLVFLLRLLCSCLHPPGFSCICFGCCGVPLVSSGLFVPSFFVGSSVPSVVSEPVLKFVGLTIPA